MKSGVTDLDENYIVDEDDDDETWANPSPHDISAHPTAHLALSLRRHILHPTNLAITRFCFWKRTKETIFRKSPECHTTLMVTTSYEHIWCFCCMSHICNLSECSPAKISTKAAKNFFSMMIITNTERWIKAWAGQGWNTKYLSVPGFIGFVCAPWYVGGGWTRYDLINTNWSNWSNRRHTARRLRADKVRPPINQGLVFRSNTVQNLWISMSWFLEQVIWHEFSLIPLIKHKWSNLLFGYISRIGLRSSATNTGKHKSTFHPSSYHAILLIFRSWC